MWHYGRKCNRLPELAERYQVLNSLRMSRKPAWYSGNEVSNSRPLTRKRDKWKHVWPSPECACATGCRRSQVQGRGESLTRGRAWVHEGVRECTWLSSHSTRQTGLGHICLGERRNTLASFPSNGGGKFKYEYGGTYCSSFPFVCLSSCLSVCLYVCVSVSVSVYLCACTPVCLNPCLFICLHVCLIVCQYGYLLVCLFVYLSLYLSFCLSVHATELVIFDLCLQC